MTPRSTTLKHTRMFASLVTAGALFAVPATGQAIQPAGHGNANKSAKGCDKKTVKVGYSVGGTYVSAVPDDLSTPAINETAITLKITSANSHARKSGDLADQDLAKKGVQAKGGQYTVAALDDAFVLTLNGYEGTDLPSEGDKVKVRGKIVLTKKKCATAGTSTADRYGAVDVRKVTISDRDLDIVA